MSGKQIGNGIVVKDGRWVMLCGSTDQPIRLMDAQNREIEPVEPKETAESHQRQPEQETAE